jgi:hypothetical protein
MGYPSRIDPAAEQLLLEMERNKLYGEVMVQYQGGKVTLLKRTETIKPVRPEQPENGEDRDG